MDKTWTHNGVLSTFEPRCYFEIVLLVERKLGISEEIIVKFYLLIG